MKKIFHSIIITSLFAILLILLFSSNSFVSAVATASQNIKYRQLVLDRAYYYKNNNYTASSFGFTSNWCLSFVNKCFTSSGHDPKGFNTTIISCSRQIEYICRNNPSAFKFIISGSTIKTNHGTTIYNNVKKATFNTSYVPVKGSVFFLDNKDSDKKSYIACHTGFVTSTEVIKGVRYIHTIEGNVDGYSTAYTSYYQNSKINYKKYKVTSTGTYLVKSNGCLDYNRQILGYYVPVFNY